MLMELYLESSEFLKQHRGIFVGAIHLVPLLRLVPSAALCTRLNERYGDISPTGKSTGSNSDSGTARPAGVAYCVLNRVAPAALHDMYQRLV
jgi:hypothetical protein